jgi:hypothetical protein
MPSDHQPPASRDSLNAQHAATREPGHRYLNTTAGNPATGRDLKLILKINIDLHEDPEHDMLMVGGLLGQPGNRVRPHINPGATSQRHDPVRRRPGHQFHEDGS